MFNAQFASMDKLWMHSGVRMSRHCPNIVFMNLPSVAKGNKELKLKDARLTSVSGGFVFYQQIRGVETPQVEGLMLTSAGPTKGDAFYRDGQE